MHLVRLLTLAALLCIGASASVAATNGAAQGQTIADAFNKNEARALVAMLNADALARRVVAGADMSRRQERRFSADLARLLPERLRAIVGTIHQNHGVARLVKSTATEDGSLQLVRFIFLDDDQYDGVNYLEFELGPDGRIRDWVDHGMATSMSANMQRSLLAITKKGATSSLFGAWRRDPAAQRGIEKVMTLLQRGDSRGAWRAMEKMPTEFRNSPEWAGLQLALATQIDDAAYMRSLAWIHERFADEPRFAVALTSYHFARRDFPAMLKALDTLEAQVVEDGLTHFLRCLAHIDLGNALAAQAECRRTTEMDPDFAQGWWMLAGGGTLTYDAPLVLDALSNIEQRFGTDLRPENVLRASRYAWLAGTPEFEAWAAEREVADP